MRGDAALSMDGVSHLYGNVTALDNLSVDVSLGEICALLGRNGAGKTTLVSILCGLLRPTAGRVFIGGEPLESSGPELRRRIGFAPQELGLYLTLTARENLVMFGELYGLRDRVLRERIDMVTESFKLEEIIDRPIHRLSGGEQRRVHSAAALLHNPEFLFLDEPTAGVDLETRDHVLAAIRALAADQGTTVLYTTHYLQEVDTLGASVAIIDRGRLIARGSVEELVREHGSRSLELRFDGDAPQIEGAEIVGAMLRIDADRSAASLSTVLRSLGREVERLSAIDVVNPGLDAVFLKLTGERFLEGAEA